MIQIETNDYRITYKPEFDHVVIYDTKQKQGFRLNSKEVQLLINALQYVLDYRFDTKFGVK